MVWGPTNLSPESCSNATIRDSVTVDWSLHRPIGGATKWLIMAKCHSRHWSLIFLNKRISIITYPDSVYYSRFALVDQSASVLLSSYQTSVNP